MTTQNKQQIEPVRAWCVWHVRSGLDANMCRKENPNVPLLPKICEWVEVEIRPVLPQPKETPSDAVSKQLDLAIETLRFIGESSHPLFASHANACLGKIKALKETPSDEDQRHVDMDNAVNMAKGYYASTITLLESQLEDYRKALKAATDLIEEYDTLYGEAYKRGKIKTLTVIFENAMAKEAK